MSSSFQHRPAQRLLLVMPSWVGDAVMATPMLRAMRELYPRAQITALVNQRVRPILEACPWIDRLVTIRARAVAGQPRSRKQHLFALGRRLARGRFDTAVLLPNSFRSALMVKLAGIPRRVGYDRDGRGVLLTDRLLPRRGRRGFLPVPTRDYYLGLAAYLGAQQPDPTMALFTRQADDQRAATLLKSAGLEPGHHARPLVLLNPGANYGDAKMWFPERFAGVADRCAGELHAQVAVTGAPREQPILKQVVDAAATPIINLADLGIELALLKSVIRMSDLMVTNDTGPRHMAAALGVPVTTIFGPTDPAWTTIGHAAEREVRVEVYCGPCQKKQCPLAGSPDELICMKRVSVDMVFEQASELLAQRASKVASP